MTGGTGRHKALKSARRRLSVQKTSGSKIKTTDLSSSRAGKGGGQVSFQNGKKKKKIIEGAAKKVASEIQEPSHPADKKREGRARTKR